MTLMTSIPLLLKTTLQRGYPWIAALNGIPAVALVSVLLFYPHAQQSGFLNWNDWHIHLFLVQEFSRQLEAGIVYPRWISALNEGLGAPVFVYYPPLAYYGAAWINAAINDSVLALKIMYGLSILGTGLGCYALFRRFVPKTEATLGAVGFITLPQFVLLSYPFNFYPSLVAWIFIPWVFYGSSRLEGWRWPWVVFTALALALTLLAHITSAVQLILILGFWLALMSASRDLHPRIAPLLVSLGLGLLLAAVYWIPAWFERDWVHFDWLLKDLSYRRQFLFRGWLDRTVPFANIMDVINEMNLVLVVSLWALLYGVWFIWKKPSLWILSLTAVVAGIGILMTPLAEGLWQALPVLQYMEFPWRWQVLFGLGCMSLLVLFLQYLRQHWPDKTQRPLLLGLSLWAIVPLCWLWFYFSPVMMAVYPTVLGHRDNYLQQWTTAEELQQDLSVLWNPVEYRPQTAGKLWAEKHLPAAEQELFEVLSGVAYIENYVDQGSRRQWVMAVGDETSTDPAIVRYKTFYFRGWQLSVDGVMVPISLDLASGLMTFQVEPGLHSVQLVFANSKTRELASYVSGLGLLLALLALLRSGWQRFAGNHLNHAAVSIERRNSF